MKQYLSIKLDYYDEIADKIIIKIMEMLQNLPKFKVIWRYQTDDNIREESGKEYAEILNIPFKFQEVS